jgi:nicotinamidase/pyrazinamidase
MGGGADVAADMAGSALIVVDIQNDFCPGGSLAVPEGNLIVPVMNRYAAWFAQAGRPVYASRDWHPSQTVHFAQYGGVWPPHCVQGTWGAAFHPDLTLPGGTVIVSKGTGPNEDAYSVLQGRLEDGTDFTTVLRDAEFLHVYIGGLATDYCVKSTVLDLVAAGFETTVLLDGTRGVNLKAHDAEEALAEMAGAGAKMTTLARMKA